MSQPNPKLYPSLTSTYTMLKCAYGDSVPQSDMAAVCHILSSRLTPDMVTAVLAPFSSEPYMAVYNSVKQLVWDGNADALQCVLKQLESCGYAKWQNEPTLGVFVPSYLMDVYEAVVCAMPTDFSYLMYQALLAVLVEDMSFRALSRVVSVVADKSYDEVLNDAYGIHDEYIPESTIEEIKQQLIYCGYSPEMF